METYQVFSAQHFTVFKGNVQLRLDQATVLLGRPSQIFNVKQNANISVLNNL